MEKVIVDSAMRPENIRSLRQGMQPPKAILERQRLIDVEYYSFDGKLHRGQIIVDVDLVNDIVGLFDLIKRIKFPIKSVIPVSDSRFMSDDDRSAYANNSSGFNYRYIAKTTKLSNHSFGRAIDLNPAINPYIRDDYRQPEGVEYDPSVVGTITQGGEIVDYLKSKGWAWGGDWTDRKDYMHFEKPLV